MTVTLQIDGPPLEAYYPIGGPPQRVPLGIAGVLLLVHATLLVLGVSLACQQSSALAHGHPIPAQVMDAALDFRRTSDLREPGQFAWFPSVAYRYVVDGQPYLGHGITPIPHLYLSKAEAMAMLGRMPVHAEITAYADLREPGRSFCVRTGVIDPYLLIALGMVVFGIAATFLLLGLPCPDAATRRRRFGVVAGYGCVVPLLSEVHYRWCGGATGWPLSIADGVALALALLWVRAWLTLRA